MTSDIAEKLADRVKVSNRELLALALAEITRPRERHAVGSRLLSDVVNDNSTTISFELTVRVLAYFK